MPQPPWIDYSSAPDPAVEVRVREAYKRGLRRAMDLCKPEVLLDDLGDPEARNGMIWKVCEQMLVAFAHRLLKEQDVPEAEATRRVANDGLH